MAYYAKIGITIETAGGRYERIGAQVEYTDAEAASVGVESGYLAYPDRRASQFTLYVKQDSGAWKEHSTYTAEIPAGGNLAFAIVDTVDLTTSTTGNPDMPAPGKINGEVDRDGTRILYSEPLQPRALPAENSFYIGEGGADTIMGFASNSLPVSEGQFGDYPLYVLGRESISALGIGTGGVAFSSAQVIAGKGCIGRSAFANTQGTVFFAASDGVWAIEGGLSSEAVSDPIVHPKGSAFLQSLGPRVALGFLNGRERRELWVSTGEGSYLFSLAHGRWSKLSRSRVGFATLGETFYGAARESAVVVPALYDEQGSPDTDRSFTIRTRPLSLDARGSWKRLYRLWARWRSGPTSLSWALYDEEDFSSLVEVASGTFSARDVASLPRGLAQVPVIELTGTGQPGQSVEGFGLEYEVRMPHRPPSLQ